jgi:hypothetical protein
VDAIAGCPLKKKACGVDAACNCGAPVVPAFRRAEEAIKADPTKSNRQIADELGIDEGSVRYAKKKSVCGKFRT